MSEKKKSLYSEEAYHILKEIELNPYVTQRDLSRKLKVSLGKINFVIKALIQKGIIEATNFKNAKNKWGYRYLLTPQGMKIKCELISQFLVWKIGEYERLESEIKQMKQEIGETALLTE